MSKNKNPLAPGKAQTEKLKEFGFLEFVLLCFSYFSEWITI